MAGYVLECKPKDPATGLKFVTFSNGYTDEGYLAQAQPYPLRLNNDFSFDTSVYSENTPGSSSLNLGTISLNNADGRFDYLLDYAWGGAAVTLKSGPDFGGYGTLTPMFTGAAQDIGGDGKTLTIILRDAGWKLAVPLQKNKYLGSNGKEGFKDLAGLTKPLCYGLNENITPVLTDQVLLCYQIHDGPIVAVTAVYDDAVPITFQGDFPTYAALVAAKLSPGYYATCLAEGFVRLGAPAAGSLTLDVQGQYYAQNDMAATLYMILLSKSVLLPSDVNLPSFNEFSLDSPFRVQGLYYSQPDTQVDAFIESLVGTADGFWVIDASGKLTIRRFKFRDPVVTIRAEDVKDLTRQVSSKPVYKTVVSYRRNMTIQDPSSFTIPTNSLTGYLDQEVVYLANGATRDGIFKVFIGDTQVNDLKIVDFQKMADVPWLVLKADGSFTISADAGDNVQVTLRASINEFLVDRTVKVRRGQPYLNFVPDEPHVFKLNSNNVPVDPAQELAFDVVYANGLPAPAVSAQTNLKDNVVVTVIHGAQAYTDPVTQVQGSSVRYSIRLSSLSVSAPLTEVYISASSSGLQNTLTMPVSRGLAGYAGVIGLPPTYGDGTPIDDLKPAAPGADVTKDNIAKGALSLGDRSAIQTLLDIDDTSDRVLEQALRQEDYKIVTDARTFIAGQPTSTYLYNFRNEQIGNNSDVNNRINNVGNAFGPVNQALGAQALLNSANKVSFDTLGDRAFANDKSITTINSTLRLLGAKTADGTGWVLDLESVQIGNGKTLATRFEEVGAASGTGAGSVSELSQVVTTLKGQVNSQYTLSVMSNGLVGGMVVNNDGTTRRIAFLTDSFVIATGTDPNNLFAPFTITNGVVYMPEVVISKLTVGSVDTSNIKPNSITGLQTQSFPDVAIPANETTVAEWQNIQVGDNVDGLALIDVQFTQDGSVTRDTAILVNAYIKMPGSTEYILMRSAPQGIVVSGGSAYWILPVSFSIPVLANGLISVKVTARGYSLAGGYTSGSFARNIQLNVFAGSR
jgi:hypothetical protein